MEDFILNNQIKQRLYNGDKSAFVDLFSKSYSFLYSYASQLLHSSEDAEDLIQDVFLRLFEQRRIIPTICDIKPYLYKMVYHAAVMKIRHKQVVARYASRVTLDFYLHELIEEPSDAIQLDNEILRDAINRNIEKLPDRCKEICRLSEREGLKNQEIADRLHISLKTVEANKTIAYSRLRKALKDFFLFFL